MTDADPPIEPEDEAEKAPKEPGPEQNMVDTGGDDRTGGAPPPVKP
jgi:hypothetical protein